MSARYKIGKPSVLLFVTALDDRAVAVGEKHVPVHPSLCVYGMAAAASLTCWGGAPANSDLRRHHGNGRGRYLLELTVGIHQGLPIPAETDVVDGRLVVFERLKAGCSRSAGKDFTLIRRRS